MKRIELAIAAILLSSTSFGPALAVEQAGVTAAVRGEVNLDPVTGEAAHAARSGEEVFLGDGISSGDASGMQLMLLDETIFTVGANTELTIDDFVYDPATGAGQMSASLTKGLFRFVAGSIAQGDPDDMTISLPTGTIGIRGTTGVVAMLDESLLDSDVLDFLDPGEGILTGSVILAVLLETEQNVDPDDKGMVVSAQGESVDLNVPGWGSFIAEGFPPTGPIFIPDVLDMGGFLANLTPSGPPGGGPGAPLGDTNGSGGGIFDLAGPLDDPPPPFDIPLTDILDESDENLGSLTPDDNNQGTTPIGPLDPNDPASADFGSFPTAGSGSYDIFQQPFTQTLKLDNPVNIVGIFDANFSINFMSRSLSGTININTSGFGGDISTSASPSPSFSPYPLSGPAQIVFNSPDIDTRFNGTTVGFTDAAETLVLNVNFNDIGSQNAGNGSSSAPLQ